MVVVVVVVTGGGGCGGGAVDLPPQSSTLTWGSPPHSSRSGAEEPQKVCTGMHVRTQARTYTTSKKTQGHAAE